MKHITIISWIVAGGGAIGWCLGTMGWTLPVAQEQPLPITGRIVPVVEMVRPAPLGKWQVETAVKACVEMVERFCRTAPDDWQLGCFETESETCTVGNTQRVGGW